MLDNQLMVCIYKIYFNIYFAEMNFISRQMNFQNFSSVCYHFVLFLVTLRNPKSVDNYFGFARESIQVLWW